MKNKKRAVLLIFAKRIINLGLLKFYLVIVEYVNIPK